MLLQNLLYIRNEIHNKFIIEQFINKTMDTELFETH